jgi:hypothetical protein
MNKTAFLINNLKINILSKAFLFVLFCYIFNYINKIQLLSDNNFLNLKVCICTLGKDENRYITEFVEHYKNYGVDKIYLYDNNDINGEKFENVIGKYIANEYVEIINWRGVKGKSTYYRIMNSCYQSYHDKYEWLIFYELDEFLYLKNYKNIKTFLMNKKFNKCQSVQLNWVHMSDNNQLFYENKPLAERFPIKGKNVVKNQYNMICYVKTIIRGHLKNISITQNHILSEKIYGCDGFGHKSQVDGIISRNPDYKFNYIRHYYGKSVQEFVEKMNRGDLLRGNGKNIIRWAIEKFFYINNITLEKLQYIRKYLGTDYNLTKYFYQLKRNN